jgi:hypothetical protein
VFGVVLNIQAWFSPKLVTGALGWFDDVLIAATAAAPPSGSGPGWSIGPSIVIGK